MRIQGDNMIAPVNVAEPEVLSGLEEKANGVNAEDVTQIDFPRPIGTPGAKGLITNYRGLMNAAPGIPEVEIEMEAYERLRTQNTGTRGPYGCPGTVGSRVEDLSFSGTIYPAVGREVGFEFRTGYGPSNDGVAFSGITLNAGRDDRLVEGMQRAVDSYFK